MSGTFIAIVDPGAFDRDYSGHIPGSIATVVETVPGNFPETMRRVRHALAQECGSSGYLQTRGLRSYVFGCYSSARHPELRELTLRDVLAMARCES